MSYCVRYKIFKETKQDLNLKYLPFEKINTEGYLFVNTPGNDSALKSQAKQSIKVKLRQPNDVSKKRPVTEAFNSCTDLSKEIDNSKAASDNKTTELLARTLHFFQVGNSSEKNKQVYKKLLSKRNIRITGNTKNPFTPAVKAFFGITQKSSVGRYAAALYNADGAGIQADKFLNFVEKSGGLGPCAETGAKLLNPNKATQDAQRRKISFDKLRSIATPLKISDLKDKLPKGPASLLVHKNADGSILLLGHHSKIISPGQYEPLI